MDTTSSVLDQQYDRRKYTLSNPEPWRVLEGLKGQPFRDYRALLARAEKGEVLTDFPVEVLIKTTLNCNHACPKCLHGVGIFPAGKQYSMRLETLQKVLDEGKAKGLQSVVFTGGEPTLHPQITDFVRYAGALGFPDISMVTNGSRLTNDALVDCLIDAGLTRLNVSVDAITRPVYETVRGVDHLDLVTAGIENLLARRAKAGGKLPLLSLSFVLSQENEHELDGFLARWKDRADGGIKIYPYKNVFSIVDDEFHQTYGAGPVALSELAPATLPVAVKKDVPLVSQYSVECMSPWYRCHVGINGELQACTTQGFCDHPAMVMGNIHKSSFEAVWKSEPWTALRGFVAKKEFDRHPVCKRCQRCV